MADAGEGVGGGAPPAIVEITYCCPRAAGRNRIEADIAAAFLRHPEITAATHWTIRIRLTAFGRDHPPDNTHYRHRPGDSELGDHDALVENDSLLSRHDLAERHDECLSAIGRRLTALPRVFLALDFRFPGRRRPVEDR